MNALVKKEIRMLLPAWITAMLLVIAPIPLALILDGEESSVFLLTLFGVAIGCIILGLVGFGREVTSGTFSLLLAQPRPRQECWRAKISVLVVALIPLAFLLGLVLNLFFPPSDRGRFALAWFLTACVAVTGGLWTTLLFRQIIASFWISALMPFAILSPAILFDDRVFESRTGSIIVTVMLLAYSVAGYWFARWQFRHAQDTAWTGGNVSLPRVERWWPWKRTVAVRQKMHPLRALLGKEFQFQQVSFMLAGLLLLVQVGVLLVQRFVTLNDNTVPAMIVNNFWGIWIIMPLLVGCSAVAEERKLGTLEPQLCLPVARAWQFAVKVFVTLICGTVLGALVPVLVQITNPAAGSGLLEFAGPWALACVCLAFVAFYASSLTQQLLQALGAAIGILVVGLLLANWFVGRFSLRGDTFSLFGVALWQGPLVLFVGATVMLLCAMAHSWRRWRWVWVGLLALIALVLVRDKMQSILTGELTAYSANALKTITLVGVATALCPVALTLALAAKNFTHTQTSPSLWWRNSVTWLGCFALTGIITALVYNRFWELAMPFEPTTGAPRLSGPVQPILAGTFVDRPTVGLLPDGRMYSIEAYEFIPLLPPRFRGNSWQLLQNPRVEFIGDSNWVSVATTRAEVAGVKSDGTLWNGPFSMRSKWPYSMHSERSGNKVTLFAGGSGEVDRRRVDVAPSKPKRIGSEADWAKVVSGYAHFVALKRNGTIWGWGNNENKQLGEAPKLVSGAPVQIDQATNWTAVFAGNGHSYAVNRDGEIWKWGRFEQINTTPRRTEGPVKLRIKVSGVRDIISVYNDSELILDTDGNLWSLGHVPPAFSAEGIPPALSGEEYDRYVREKHYSESTRLGDPKWLAVSFTSHSLIGLKTDGTLWVLRSRELYNWPLPKMTQLGKRTDWIAVASHWEVDLALAKDGTICRFGELNSGVDLLAPTRRVTWSLNLLDAAK